MRFKPLFFLNTADNTVTSNKLTNTCIYGSDHPWQVLGSVFDSHSIISSVQKEKCFWITHIMLWAIFIHVCCNSPICSIVFSLHAMHAWMLHSLIIGLHRKTCGIWSVSSDVDFGLESIYVSKNHQLWSHHCNRWKLHVYVCPHLARSTKPVAVDRNVVYD